MTAACPDVGPRRLAVLSGAFLIVCALLAALSAPAGQAETVQRGNLRVSFAGKLAPTALPRQGAAPIAVTVGGQIATTDGTPPPQLRGIEIKVNRAGRFDLEGLPSCTYEEIQPSTTAAAQAACGPAKVGEGSFAANVLLPEQSPFPSEGKIVAFNATIPCSAAGDPARIGWAGRTSPCTRPAILAHVYGTVPVPLSYTLVLRMTPGKGIWGTVLSATLPEVTADVAYVTGISLTLDRRFTSAGRTHGYLSAGCPAPQGFPGATFPLARASFSFAAGGTLASTLERSCRVKDRGPE